MTRVWKDRTTLAMAAAATVLGATWVEAASAADSEIGAVIQRTYRGATAEGQQAARPIYFRNDVYAQELVKTGVRGSTELEFLDNTHLVVGPNGEVRLDEFVYDPASATGGGQISLRVGAFRYQSGKLKNKENVKLVTPTATMTIRGTHLVIFVGADGATEDRRRSRRAGVQYAVHRVRVGRPAGRRHLRLRRVGRGLAADAGGRHSAAAGLDGTAAGRSRQ